MTNHYPQRLIGILIALIATVATTTGRTYAQTISVGGYNACIDATTQRALVTIPSAKTAKTLPATISIEGRNYEVETTTLPIVRLQHGTLSSTEFNTATLTIVTPDGETNTYHASLRYRGATALTYDKKNYAIKLTDDNGQQLDVPLLGMRSDNSWILDGMANDFSRMRNRVSTDLWLDFSHQPYYANEEPLLSNGTHGKFVEVFVGDRYWGLYCLTEKIDRKQLRVKKFKDDTPRGIIYKSVSYDNMIIISDPSPDNNSSTWQGWETAYPDVRKGEPFDWMPLLDLYYFFAQEVPSFLIIDHLHQRIDIPVWRDYTIFCDLIHADDNVAKNMYVYYRDITQPATFINERGKTETVDAPGPLSVCPWDLDATWGRNYKGNYIDPTANCNVANAPNYHLNVSQLDQGKSYITRWAQLRKSTFTPSGLWAYFQRYFDLFETSGAAHRETERWQDVNNIHLDFNAERDFIHQWITERLTYLDGDYQYNEGQEEGIATIVTDTTPASITYTLDGRRLPASPAAPGLYISGGKKMLVK